MIFLEDNEILSGMETDAIGEILNISLGSSATAVSELLGQQVNITTPEVKVMKPKEFEIKTFEPAIGVEINYIEGLSGKNILILREADVKVIVGLLLQTDFSDREFVMDEMNIVAICEVMNQMMGSAATALSDFLGKTINISTPIAYEIDNKTEFKNKYFSEDDVIVAVSFELFIEGSVQSQFINVMSVTLSREIISSFLKGSEALERSENDNVSDVVKTSTNNGDEINTVEDKHEDDLQENESKDEEDKQHTYTESVKAETHKKKIQKRRQQSPVSVKPVKLDIFDDEEETASEEQLSNLEMIMSVPLEISVEIGKAKRQIKDILEFSKGTIVELDRQAGALVDIIVNGQLIAKGEVVVVNDNFGVRIVEIIKKEELVKLKL